MPEKYEIRRAERLLQRSLNDPNARFREGQWEAIDGLLNRRSRVRESRIVKHSLCSFEKYRKVSN